MRILVGILLFLGATLLQVTLATRVTLLQGAPDLVLLVLVAWLLLPGNRPDWRWGLPAGLMVGYASALPDWVLLAGYAAGAGVCQLLSQRIWQVKLFTLLSGILLATLAVHLVTMLYLLLAAQPLNMVEAFNLITIPTMLLNLIFVLPLHAIMNEVSKLVQPIEEPA
ncbi:MAG: hypothetical protein KIS85_03130 [Anaerolineales bacterium]|nr:hypothetical protein [Anaerolineales bacterium]